MPFLFFLQCLRTEVCTMYFVNFNNEDIVKVDTRKYFDLAYSVFRVSLEFRVY